MIVPMFLLLVGSVFVLPSAISRYATKQDLSSLSIMILVVASISSLITLLIMEVQQ